MNRTIAYLAVLGTATFLATPALASIHQLFDQNVTPDVIFGSGNANGGFTVDQANNVEVGLRAKQRFPAANIFNSNGDGTYSFATGVGTGTDPDPKRPLWNFEWSVNTNLDGTGGSMLDTLAYELRIDFDPSQGTSNFQTFDPINLSFADHAIGNSSTVNGGGTVATGSTLAAKVADYASLLSTNSVAQNSWTMTFFDDATHVFDPDIDGTYTIELDVINESGLLASASIDVIVGAGGAAPEPTTFLVWSLLGLVSTGRWIRRHSA